jgi:tryptophan synthase alpha chain
VTAGAVALDEAFAAARAEGRAVLIGYLPAGFPDRKHAVEGFRAMRAGGVDVIEVGVPYTDPLMDGPVIQQAVDQALAGGIRLADVFETVAAAAATGAPTLAMTYWNPVERHGVDAFAAQLAGTGAAGLITPDLLPEEAGPWLAAADRHGLARVFLVAPSSPVERIAEVAAASRGFVYAASTMGVTGARDQVDRVAAELVARVRTVTDRPVAVGLGVSAAGQAAEVAGYADGVVVGSAFVRCLLPPTDPAAGVAAVRRLAEELAGGVRGRVPEQVR